MSHNQKFWNSICSTKFKILAQSESTIGRNAMVKHIPVKLQMPLRISFSMCILHFMSLAQSIYSYLIWIKIIMLSKSSKPDDKFFNLSLLLYFQQPSSVLAVLSSCIVQVDINAEPSKEEFSTWESKDVGWECIFTAQRLTWRMLPFSLCFPEDLDTWTTGKSWLDFTQTL